MGYDRYEDDVLRTLSLQFNLGEEAGPNAPTPATLARSLRRAVEIGVELDHLKRAIFYGSLFSDENIRAESSEFRLGDDSSSSQYPSPDMIHSALGLFTEAAEFLEAVASSCFGGNAFDRVNVIEELGDIEWYMAVMRRRLGVSQEDVQRRNIAKLKARYPDRFRSDSALNRNLEAERDVLASGD